MVNLREAVVHLVRGTLTHDDIYSLTSILKPSITLHIAGSNLISGTRCGRYAAVGELVLARQHYQHNPYDVTVSYVAENGCSLVVRSNHRALMDGRPVTWNQTTILIFDEGKVVDFRIFADDVKAFNTYWAKDCAGLPAPPPRSKVTERAVVKRPTSERQTTR